VELCIVLEELGRCLAPVAFLPTAIAGAGLLELGDAAQQKRWLPALASGEVVGTLALTEQKGDEPAALNLQAKRAGDGWELTGRKLFVPNAAAAGLALVVARVDGEAERGLGLFAVPADSAGLTLEPMRSMDLLRPLSTLDFQNVRLPNEALLGGDADAWPRIERTLDRARVMLCAEMLGGAEKCLEDSVEYAKQRVQFGKPIGVHQAIKHKCADMLFEVESSRSITYYAAWAAREDAEEAPVTASMAKSYVSDAYRHVSSETIQIHGGVGFTWEYDCHLYFKRARSDEAWLGDGTHHRERVARLLNV
jgi:alkylation response protein AidB-like acyl-CoA dehydrogenase